MNTGMPSSSIISCTLGLCRIIVDSMARSQPSLIINS